MVPTPDVGDVVALPWVDRLGRPDEERKSSGLILYPPTTFHHPEDSGGYAVPHESDHDLVRVRVRTISQPLCELMPHLTKGMVIGALL